LGTLAAEASRGIAGSERIFTTEARRRAKSKAKPDITEVAEPTEE
jgi:hypothetical protein